MYMPACELFLCAMGACVCFGLVVLFFSCSVYLLSLLFEIEREREREERERERERERGLDLSYLMIYVASIFTQK